MGLISFLVALAPLISTALGASMNVQVSDNEGKLVFHPNYVWANPGDQIHFRFWPKNHTVTQSSFASPCVKLVDGFDTGFVPVSQEQSDSHQRPWKTFNVTDSSPKWFYCRQKGHCGSGMVFAVNPQDGQFETFRAAAIQQNGTSATNSSTSVTPKACASTDDSGSSLVSESGLVGGLFTCVYQSAGTCQYFTDGSFSSGASTCPDKVPGQQGLGSGGSDSTSTGSSKQCPSQDQQQSSLISEADASGGFVACTYTTARICTYFKADGSFSSGSSDCPAKITGSSSSTNNASGALADGDTSGSTNLSTLIRNSWIILGLIAGILVLLLVFAIITIVSRKGLRGRETKYSKVSVPKAFQGEEDSMTHKRYDDSDM